jgi:transposase
MAMVVQCPDDLVGATHPVRAVAAKLDLSRFEGPIKAREGQAGRDATDPELLVGLWLYARARGIGSARELARRGEDGAAFRWLCGGVRVNHRLLSDFHTDHGEALDGLLTQVIASLVDKEAVRVSRVSQDGVRVHEQGVELFLPPKPARQPGNRGRELEAKRGDTEAALRWKRRMRSDEGKEIYKQRASTSETVNAELRSYRGLVQITVRGLKKARCVALWCALA